MRQMMLSEMNRPLLNPSVETADENRLSQQAIKVCDLFLNGNGGYRAVWTNELSKNACQYCARISEIRRWLMKKGLTLDITDRDKFGNHRYVVREFEGSNYQRLLRKKGLA